MNSATGVGPGSDCAVDVTGPGPSAGRRRELGVGMAVGATLAGVVGLVARSALALVAVGLALGVVGALAANGVPGSFLFQVRPFAPAVYAAVTVVLLVVAMAAALAPALRAARVDPARVLGEE